MDVSRTMIVPSWKQYLQIQQQQRNNANNTITTTAVTGNGAKTDNNDGHNE